jgi:hypothetical protein
MPLTVTPSAIFVLCDRSKAYRLPAPTRRTVTVRASTAIKRRGMGLRDGRRSTG